MHDPAPYRDAKGHERWLVLGAFVLAIAALVGIVLEDYEPVKLAPLFMVLAWFPLIALHEGGHAIAARACGWHVEEIVVGFGRPVASFWIRGVPLTLKTYPLAGYVRPVPNDLRAVRVKSAIVYAAGPLIELALCGALLAIVGGRMFERTDDVWIIAAQAVCLAALIGVIGNLVPRPIDTEHGKSWTDGLGVIMSFVRTRESWVRQLVDRHEREIDDLSELGDIERFVRACEEAERALPNEPHLKSAIRLATAKLRRDKHKAAELERALSARTRATDP
jgi:hypothetical protein